MGHGTAHKLWLLGGGTHFEAHPRHASSSSWQWLTSTTSPNHLGWTIQNSADSRTHLFSFQCCVLLSGLLLVHEDEEEFSSWVSGENLTLFVSSADILKPHHVVDSKRHVQSTLVYGLSYCDIHEWETFQSFNLLSSQWVFLVHRNRSFWYVSFTGDISSYRWHE